MKLEDEIKQIKFNTNKTKLAVNLIYTGNWYYSHMSTYLKQFDLTVEQFNILRILRGQYPNPATINLLIERMLNKMSNASRLVDKLEKKKLLKRNKNSKDKRAVDVIITKLGLTMLSKIDKDEILVQKKLDTLEDSEITQLNNLLDKLRK
jgi:DNA-binding MarR family transcriptional regulator